MKIFIYSTQFEIGQIIYDHLTSLGNLCFLFPSTEHLSNSLSNVKDYPDLLILDYTTFNHDLFNIRNYFNDLKIEMAVIFYNDPCLTKSSRSSHWLSQIKLLQNLKIEDYSDYEALFLQLQELIEDPHIRPYIKLMEDPLPIPEVLKKKTLTLDNIKENLKDSIECFRDKVKLPNNLYYLLKIFRNNNFYPMSLQEIQKIYNDDKKQISETSLKVLISKLRGEIEKDPSCKFRISNERGLYSFLKKIDI